MKLSENRKRGIVTLFKQGYSMSDVGVMFGLGTLEVEGIIREWMVEENEKELDIKTHFNY